jgi:hypothetical protein
VTQFNRLVTLAASEEAEPPPLRVNVVSSVGVRGGAKHAAASGGS